MKTRRTFIQQLITAGIAVNIPFVFNACSSPNTTQIPLIKQNILNENQLTIAHYFFQYLFPSTDGFNTNTLHTLNHFIRILSDSNYNEDDRKYLIQGLDWTAESSQEHYQKQFTLLSNTKKEALFETIVQEKWGKSWLSYMLDCCFESLLIDPIYNVNTKQISWKWLGHQAGIPSPKTDNQYQKLLAKKTKTQIITAIEQL